MASLNGDPNLLCPCGGTMIFQFSVTAPFSDLVFNTKNNIGAGEYLVEAEFDCMDCAYTVSGKIPMGRYADRNLSEIQLIEAVHRDMVPSIVNVDKEGIPFELAGKAAGKVDEFVDVMRKIVVKKRRPSKASEVLKEGQGDAL